MIILMKGGLKQKYLLLLTESTFHSLNFHHCELKFARVGHFITPRIGLYRSAKMGRENVIMQLKEDTQYGNDNLTI